MKFLLGDDNRIWRWLFFSSVVYILFCHGFLWRDKIVIDRIRGQRDKYAREYLLERAKSMDDTRAIEAISNGTISVSDENGGIYIKGNGTPREGRLP